MVPYSFLAFFGIWGITRNITKAMTVLMVDYSCAIKLSTPVAVGSAMDEAAKFGMTVKGGNTSRRSLQQILSSLIRPVR